MFTIEMMPAERGDCMWVCWGDAGEHVMLIDGGPSQTIETLVPELERRLASLPGGDNRVELLVQTHIDADHIQGVVSLLSAPGRVRLFRDVWFNGRHHLTDVLGPAEGEMVTAALESEPARWNRAFNGAAVVVPNAPAALPVVELTGGLKLTLLAPSSSALGALSTEWERWASKVTGRPAVPKKWQRSDVLGAFDPEVWASGKYTEDRSKPNGAGIAFVAEYGRRRVLFTADVPPRYLVEAFARLPDSMRVKSGPDAGRVRFDAVKMSHHGSRNNTSQELCGAIASPRWLISSNGARYGHPHPEALARVILSQNRPPSFVLNYVTPAVEDLIEGAGTRWKVVLPKRVNGEYEEGVVVSLS